MDNPRPTIRFRSWPMRRLAVPFFVAGICLGAARGASAPEAPRTLAEMARFVALDASVKLQWDSLPASRISVEILTAQGIQVRNCLADNATGVVVATVGLPPGAYQARAMRDGVVQHWGFFRK